MRRYLFRGKRPSTGEWIHGDLLTDYTSTPVKAWIRPDQKSAFEVDPETVGELTGETDLGGVPIFEGDICLDQAAAERVISYQYGSWTWEYYENPREDWRVKGNIHDNPTES